MIFAPEHAGLDRPVTLLCHADLKGMVPTRGKTPVKHSNERAGAFAGEHEHGVWGKTTGAAPPETGL